MFHNPVMRLYATIIVGAVFGLVTPAVTQHLRLQIDPQHLPLLQVLVGLFTSGIVWSEAGAGLREGLRNDDDIPEELPEPTVTNTRITVMPSARPTLQMARLVAEPAAEVAAPPPAEVVLQRPLVTAPHTRISAEKSPSAPPVVPAPSPDKRALSVELQEVPRENGEVEVVVVARNCNHDIFHGITRALLTVPGTSWDKPTNKDGERCLTGVIHTDSRQAVRTIIAAHR